MKKRHVMTGAAVLAGGLAFTGNADATLLLQEDFEGPALGPFVSASESGGDGTDWTSALPGGWTRDNSGNSGNGVPEFEGWTLMDKNSWDATAGQGRANFLLGQGTVVVADGDEYDDGPTNGGSGGPLNTFLVTPNLNINGTGPGTLQLEFDSSWFPYGGMVGRVDVRYNGGAWQNVLEYNTGNTGGNSNTSRQNEHIVLNVNNPQGGVAQFRWQYQGGNDWWWAIDNVTVTPEPASIGLLGLGGLMMLRRRQK